MYGNQFQNPDQIAALASMGQHYDPTMRRQNLLDAFKAQIMGRPTPPQNARREAIMQRVAQTGAPTPQTVGDGVGQALSSLGAGLELRQHNRGPFPEMPGGGRPGVFRGLANMFNISTGGLY